MAKHEPGETPLPRVEWSIWLKVNATKGLKRQVDYGDYGIQNPGPTNAGHSGNANLRYTLDTRWAIFRGEKIDLASETKNLTALMKPLCRMAASSPRFEGRDFSWADEHIESCAGMAIPENEHSTWKAVGFNHHMTHVVQQILAETSRPI